MADKEKIDVGTENETDEKSSKKKSDKNAVIDTEPTLDEALDRTAVIGWGRLNPMTSGHQLIVDKLKKEARARNGVPMLFMSHSYDPKKNPLSYNDKIRFAQTAFGDLVKKSNSRTIIEVLKELDPLYNTIVLVVGSDRVTEFKTLLNKYNGREFDYDEIVVVSVGQRDPDADGVAGVSASKVRAAVAAGDYAAFVRMLPPRLVKISDEVWTAVANGMGVSAEITEALNMQQRRKRAINMKKYSSRMVMARKRAARRHATNDKLETRARRQARDMVRAKLAGLKDTPYSELPITTKMLIDKKIEKKQPVINKLAKKLLPKVKRAEIERLRAMRNVDEEVLNELHPKFMQPTVLDRALESLKKLVDGPMGDSQSLEGLAFSVTRTHKVGITARQLAQKFREKYGVAEEYELDVNDLFEEVIAEEGGAGEWGTKSLRDKYKKDTPDGEREETCESGLKEARDINEMFEEYLDEQIKGWKHAGRDISAVRSAQGKNVKLVSLKKNGEESKMSDASSIHGSEKEAREVHDRRVKLNPKMKIRHNLYVDGKLVTTLGEAYDPRTTNYDNAEEAVKAAKDSLKNAKDSLDTVAVMKRRDEYTVVNTQAPAFQSRPKQGWATVAYVSNFGKKVKTDTPHKHLAEAKNSLVAHFSRRDSSGNVYHVKLWKSEDTGRVFVSLSNQHGVPIHGSAIDVWASGYAAADRNFKAITGEFKKGGVAGAKKYLEKLSRDKWETNTVNEETLTETPTVRFHQLRNPDGTIKLDGRFRAFKKNTARTADNISPEDVDHIKEPSSPEDTSKDHNRHADQSIKEADDLVARVRQKHKREDELLNDKQKRELASVKIRSARMQAEDVDLSDDDEMLSLVEEIFETVQRDEEKTRTAITEKAEKSGISEEILLEVYNRGVDSWTNKNGVTPQQWGMSRCNSFIAGGKARSLDEDLWEKHLNDA